MTSAKPELNAKRRGVANPRRFSMTYDLAGNRHTTRLWAVSEDAAEAWLRGAFPANLTILTTEEVDDDA